jgi:hypothetical protein
MNNSELCAGNRRHVKEEHIAKKATLRSAGWPIASGCDYPDAAGNPIRE